MIWLYVSLWVVACLILGTYILPRSWGEIRKPNGFRRWKWLLFWMSNALMIGSSLATTLYVGMIVGVEFVPIDVARTVVGVSVVMAVICIALMYRR